MQWEKKGIVFSPSGVFSWSKTHAQVPVVDTLNSQRWRIYYATRGVENQSCTSYIEVEAGNPGNILYIHDKPILEFGHLGSFDEHGIMPSSILEIEDRKYLYYIGWSQRKSVPYQNSIGLAVSSDGGKTFKKYSEGPIVGINDVDPYFTGTFFALKDDKIYRGYYLSCIEWRIVGSEPEPIYILKYAQSENAVNWLRKGDIAVSFKSVDEGGLVSASVIKCDGRYLMWYGVRNYFDFRTNKKNSYRIGFAESADGVQWNRMDEKSGISVSETGWDSEMISYPYVIRYGDRLYLFYNGNQFGKFGFGYAIMNLV
jgi:hypothetical protein